MDPIRNPYAPGAGQRPPELAGPRPGAGAVRGHPRAGGGRPARAEHGALRAARGRQDRAAQRAARPGGDAGPGGPARSRPGPTRASGSRWPRPCTPRSARSPTGTATPTGSTRSPACSSRSRCAPSSPTARGMRWTPPVDAVAVTGRADSGDLELDLVELFGDVASLAGDLGVGIALFVDEMQDISTDELAALCGACHEISQQGAPLVVVGAGLPHLPVALAASKSYAERLFRYVSVDRLPREMAERAWRLPAGSEDVDVRGRRDRRALPRSPTATPTSCRPTARSPGTPPSASPDHRGRRARGGARGRGRARRRLLRRPLRPGHPGRARLHERDGRPRRRQATARSPPPTSRATSTASRSRSRPPATG